uniref:NADH-ubiquinone oxidoreductase 75 kDa subunit, mitochondrial n=1 Tax=Panagrolaimus superbus TaxID=310955 RepID=A0A914ZBS7_9BILA
MKKVVTVCPYCASGCKINLVVDNGKIVRAEAAQGKTNQGTLCLKGYYGWDFINDTQILTPRLKTPMIRRQRGGKLEPVSWDEALNYVAERLSAIKEKYGPDAIQTTGSSRANHVINAKRNGAKIIVCDPRKIETARIADMHIALKNGSNIALLNAMGHVIIEENLYDKAFVASRTEGFEEYRKIVEGYTPESVEDITGVSASEIRQAARMYAQAKSAAILWGMGVTQFYQGVETVRSLTSLAMLTGNLGKPHAGVNPDIFMTKTASAADVILPSTSWGEHEGVFTAADRGFQRFFKAVEPKWDLKTDWQIISEIATRMGYPMHYNNTQEIWDELRHLCPDFYGATYEKMGELGFIQWPCRDTSDADQGTSYLFKEKFDTLNGLAQFFTCDWVAPIDKLTDEYPMVLSTVREVGHYSCRSMTGNCAALAALADEPGYAQINTEDAKRLGIEDEALVWVHSRKGKIITRAQVSDRPNKGAIYMTYQWWIGACNELVTENLSPITKTPEYKYCAVRVEPIADQRAAEQYVIDEYNKLKTRLREAALA